MDIFPGLITGPVQNRKATPAKSAHRGLRTGMTKRLKSIPIKDLVTTIIAEIRTVKRKGHGATRLYLGVGPDGNIVHAKVIGTTE